MVALIPARAGSKRIPGKNTRLLAGHPLIAYTIAAALESGVFSGVTVSTDDKDIRAVAYQYGAHVMYRRARPTPEDSPDIDWIQDYFTRGFEAPDAFAILRPTSPFRSAETIRRAYAQFMRSEVHSIRAVQPVREHPGKMWQLGGPGHPMRPIWQGDNALVPWHSSPTQTLPAVYVQNSSLEMAWTYVVKSFGTISGKKIAPFFTNWPEGFSIDYPDDWERAEQIAHDHPEYLPTIHQHVTAQAQ